MNDNIKGGGPVRVGAQREVSQCGMEGFCLCMGPRRNAPGPEISARRSVTFSSLTCSLMSETGALVYSLTSLIRRLSTEDGMFSLHCTHRNRPSAACERAAQAGALAREGPTHTVLMGGVRSRLPSSRPARTHGTQARKHCDGTVRRAGRTSSSLAKDARMPPLPQRARARKPCAVKHVQRPQPSPPNQTQTARSGSAVRRVLLPAGLSAAAGSGATTRGAAECAGRARRGPIAAVRGPAAKAMPGRRGRMALRPAGALRCKGCPMHHREPSTVHGAGRAARARAGRAALVWLWAHHACGEAAALGSFQAEESLRQAAAHSTVFTTVR